MAEEARKRIGDYEIVRELGHGGMGQVYLVRNAISDRVEAMKVLLPDLAQQGDLANRFMREIKVLASLEHPNIAQLRTAFTAENQLVMIMEYVEGDTLAQRLERGAFSPADALNYMGQVLGALSYAHGKGIIHRDIKPANMMLTPQGVIKLMDFGIARSTQDLGMTVTGTTLGSVCYMSPEQVKSEPTDARSDLYSAGVSLYEMVTGHTMFSATSSFSIMEAHVKEIPHPPIELQPTLPKALNDIIMMAVAKDPSQRFQTADAFRNALSQVGVSAAAAAAPPQQQPIPTPSPQPKATTPPLTPAAAPASQQEGCAVLQPRPAEPGRRHIGWILAAAIVILVAVFGGTQVYRSHTQSSTAVPAVESGAGAAPGTSNLAPSPAAPGTNSSVGQSESAAATPAPLASAPPNPASAPRSTKHQDASAAPQGAAPAESGPSAEEIAAHKKLLDDMETETDHLDSRAAAVESSLDTMEQQMHQSGLGLRGDVVASRANMRADLAKAKQALEGSDTDRARKYLDQANHEVEKLEAFLGRR
jgi:serine/threonine-protein kinase